MAAEQVAAKLNQSIAAGGAGGGAPPMGGVGPHAGLGLVQSEEWSIPNKVVGLGIVLGLRINWFICSDDSFNEQCSLF